MLRSGMLIIVVIQYVMNIAYFLGNVEKSRDYQQLRGLFWYYAQSYPQVSWIALERWIGYK